MDCYVDLVLRIAEKEVGYVEKDSNQNLDSKTGNPGTNNYTKYARDLDAISGFYSGKKQGYPWCDVFVDYCFVTAYGVDNAKRLLCQPEKSLGASCRYSMSYYRKTGQLYDTPLVGDQIFFTDKNGTVCHTGIVYKVDKKYVYTIEGNTSSDEGVVANGGCVRKKKYSLTYNRIAGYGRPEYDVKLEEVKTVKVELPVLKKGLKGSEVKTLQILLREKGYNIGNSGIDGSFGSKTEAAVMKFQTKNKLEADGCVGKKTWPVILGTR